MIVDFGCANAIKYFMPTYVLVHISDLENKIYVASHSRNDVDTPFKDTIVGFGCFNADCQVFWILIYFCKMT